MLQNHGLHQFSRCKSAIANKNTTLSRSRANCNQPTSYISFKFHKAPTSPFSVLTLTDLLISSFSTLACSVSRIEVASLSRNSCGGKDWLNRIVTQLSNGDWRKLGTLQGALTRHFPALPVSRAPGYTEFGHIFHFLPCMAG